MGAGIAAPAGEGAEVIGGTRVSGTRPVRGRARVMSDRETEIGAPIPDFREGDIVVAAMIHPAWLPYFRQAGGFVARIGGWLSHTAILAREHDVAMVVNTAGIEAIATGDLLQIESCGRIDVLERPRARSAIAA